MYHEKKMQRILSNHILDKSDRIKRYIRIGNLNDGGSSNIDVD